MSSFCRPLNSISHIQGIISAVTAGIISVAGGWGSFRWKGSFRWRSGTGPGMWKMNVSLLDDEEHLHYLSFNISNWKSEGERELSDRRCVWDWIKYNIGMHAIRYSKEKAKQRNDKEKMINQEYKETTRRFEKDPSDYNRSLLNEIKEKLELSYGEKTNGIIVRARARCY